MLRLARATGTWRQSSHMRQSENEYWRSWLQSSADCTSQNEDLEPTQQEQSLQETASPLVIVPSSIMSAGTRHQTEQAQLPHVAGLSAPASGRNSASVSSISTSRNARHHQQKRQAAKRQQARPLSSNASLVNVAPCQEQSPQEGACPFSRCLACGWQPGSSSLDAVAASHYHSCSEDLGS